MPYFILFDEIEKQHMVKIDLTQVKVDRQRNNLERIIMTLLHFLQMLKAV